MASVSNQTGSKPFVIKKNPHVSREQANESHKFRSENKTSLSEAQIREAKKLLIKKKKLEMVQRQFNQDTQKM
jgi:hypothetical protein